MATVLSLIFVGGIAVCMLFIQEAFNESSYYDHLAADFARRMRQLEKQDRRWRAAAGLEPLEDRRSPVEQIRRMGRA